MPMNIYRCSDCECHTNQDDLHAITEDDIIDHLEQGGFIYSANHLERVGEIVCPRCKSSSIELVDSFE